MIHDIMDTKAVPVLVGIFIILFVMESVSQLLKRREKRMRRAFINALFSIPGFVALRVLLPPAMVWIAHQNEHWEFGLNDLYALPLWVEGVITFLLLGYTNYLWHILNHKLPFLWRFHLVHHTDVDLDVTTAIRFHAGKIIASVFFRGFVVLMVGASPMLVLIYEVFFEAATQFHHSNWKLPFHIEKSLNRFIVTPRMRGIHHSIIRKETDSDYSVIFSLWDRIHRDCKTWNTPERHVNWRACIPRRRTDNRLSFETTVYKNPKLESRYTGKKG